MVTQQKTLKTSSASGWRVAPGEKRYEIKTSVEYEAVLPKNTELRVAADDLAAGVAEYARFNFVEVENHYAIVGTLGDERADASRWKEMPHEAFANLRLDDTKAVASFVKTHGVLWGIKVDGYSIEGLSIDVLTEEQMLPRAREAEWSERDSPARFHEGSVRLFEYQRLIRRAWSGDDEAAREIQKTATLDVEIRPAVNSKGVTLVAKKLGSLIFVIFLRDYAARKCGVCSNPDCPARYFLRRRKTQKFCESGPCVTYARRRYALKWWRDKGAKIRAKKQHKLNRRTKR
jgi:hypothetical protein